MSAFLNQLAVRMLRGVILGYRLLISPFFPPSCRFAPTCSEYALEAINTHGAIRGTYLAARRLLRCHPIKMLGGSSGFDPVPPKSDIKTSNCSCEHAKPDAQHRQPNRTDDLRAFHKGI